MTTEQMPPLPDEAAFPGFPAWDRDAMHSYARAYAAQEVEKERALLKIIHASLECDGHGFWSPDWCIKEYGKGDVSAPTFDEFCEFIRARGAA